jgi:indoleamine 2,3-dioxygenase
MEWHLSNRGFLPDHDPLQHLKDPALQPIEQLGAELPRLVHERAFRDECGDYLNGNIDWDTIALTRGDADIERLFLLFSYFASAYVHSPELPPTERLPKAIALPLVKLGQRVKRPPILSYASYCLHNWRRLDPAGGISLGNIALLQNFSTPGDGKSDEDWFILVHVNIEAFASPALQSFRLVPKAVQLNDLESVDELLVVAAESMKAMNAVMNMMPEGCSAEVYFKKVRPYIFGFNNIIYEGCFNNEPQNYRGETGAQSSIVPTMLRALGIEHKNSMLIAHLDDMQNYMPAPHRDFINHQVSVREFVLKHRKQLGDAYNRCLTELIAFRSRHFEYAVNYIEKKVDNPIATGGTPYIPWLRQLIDETKEFLLA